MRYDAHAGVPKSPIAAPGRAPGMPGSATVCRLFTLAGMLSLLAAGAHPTRAGASRTMGCALTGYTMLVPHTWIVATPCSFRGTAHAPGQPIALVVVVERHGWWNDDRSYSSIRNDIAASGTGRIALVAPAFSVRTIAGHRFFRGMDLVRERDGTRHTVIEMETFVVGFMYKFVASVGGPLSGSASTLEPIDRIWSSIRFNRAHSVPGPLPRGLPTPLPTHSASAPAPTHPPASPTVAAPARRGTPAPALSPTVVPLDLFAVVVPGRIPVGARATLFARTAPGATCQARVTLTSGRTPASFDGHALVVPPGGQVSWSWRQETRVPGGTASVTCSRAGATITSSVSFAVTP